MNALCAKRINEAMTISHKVVSIEGAISARKAQRLMAKALDVEIDTARTLFGIMRILGFIEECDGGFRAGLKPFFADQIEEERP